MCTAIYSISQKDNILQRNYNYDTVFCKKITDVATKLLRCCYHEATRV